jgi:hypothetical protein
MGLFGHSDAGLMPAAANDTVTSFRSRAFLEGTNLKAMTLQAGASLRRRFVGVALGLIAAVTPWSAASALEKLVDPNLVAPEYRAAAEKRRAEQVKLFECSKKADEAKVSRRDRVAYINDCLDK